MQNICKALFKMVFVLHDIRGDIYIKFPRTVSN